MLEEIGSDPPHRPAQEHTHPDYSEEGGRSWGGRRGVAARHWGVASWRRPKSPACRFLPWVHALPGVRGAVSATSNLGDLGDYRCGVCVPDTRRRRSSGRKKSGGGERIPPALNGRVSGPASLGRIPAGKEGAAPHPPPTGQAAWGV